MALAINSICYILKGDYKLRSLKKQPRLVATAELDLVGHATCFQEGALGFRVCRVQGLGFRAGFYRVTQECMWTL